MKIKPWILLSRIPFLMVSILPYILGSMLAWHIKGKFNLTVFLLGLCGVILIQLVTHYNGELYDIEEDRFSAGTGRNLFSGGSQVLVQKLIPVKKVKIVSYTALFLALSIGALLQFYFKTGPWTLTLGALGILSGFFYSKPPLRWVSSGAGEILIAFSFGWLTVSTGFYLQSSHFNLLATLMSLPIACAVANIILINEFPDYPADQQAGKKNILVRLGKGNGAVLYSLLSACGIFLFFYAFTQGAPVWSVVFYLPVSAISLFLVWMILKEAYQDPSSLEKMCMFTILINLGTCLAYMLGLLF